MSNPFFSIIVPVYMVETFLDQCIQSVLNQTFANYELILVDDGSPDICPQLCDDWAKKDSKIISIHKTNGGLSSARNAGLEKATGRYVIFLDSDDYWMDKLLLQNAFDFIKERKQPDVDVILFQAQKYIEENGTFIKDQPYDADQINILEKDETIKYLIETGTYSMSACTKILKREMLIRHQVTFEVGLLGEDLDWFFKLVFAASNIYAIPNWCYVYRFRVGSITHTVGRKNIQDAIWTITRWSKELEHRLNQNDFAKYYFGILAYAQVVNMLNYAKMGQLDKKQLRSAVKNNCYLLKYETNSRIRMVNRVYRVLGFDLTTRLLALYYKLSK